jgi:ectoine hydroxylase-related dioxygenase (phytanoyl-CoA dioxygenase family)
VNAIAKTWEAALPDLSAAKADLDANGFCVVPDVLDPETLAAVRTRTLAQAEAERALGLMPEGGLEGPNQRVFMLVNKGQEFLDLITHPVALALAGHLLGGSFLLSQFSANIARRGGVEQGLHCDDWWSPRPIRQGQPFKRVGDFQRYNDDARTEVTKGEVLAPPCVINIAWMLSDFSDENGGTRLARGSHLSGHVPDGSVPHKVPTVAAAGKAGSVLAFDGRTWHGTGKNLTDDPRIVLLLTFCGPQFRSQENFFVGLDPRVYEAAPEQLRALMGFKIWSAYGRTEVGAGKAFVTPGERSFPRLSLRPDGA